MKVKICGITDLYTAEKAVEYGTDALGFVFAKSKRQVDVETVRKIVTQINSDVLKVGVFVNESPDKIRNISEICRLDFVQLHGNEPFDIYQQFAAKMIKAFGVKDTVDLEKAAHYPSQYILLDSPKGKYEGGNGQTFNWQLINKNRLQNKQIILAGGLTEENVKKAIEIVQPYMVDVSSGVETNGKKDVKKIKEFINVVKSCER